ncbi:hypothetical protein K6U06_08800 [Acidiferrimicrobium sp. IK]|uniref:hypothetical protein n=1 Tax=Acidiferrimicrobium sp. IK TaxID=2871700 RepID=UPI0021CAE980|nr:hypothetical protein [Acidiferrimicrobium sp. IK]MCU4184457.1 hypothetical protein [Acidiferrimicrobium sp. IK]
MPERDIDTSNPDIDQADTSFGHQARQKQERADRLEEQGVDPTSQPEGEGADPRPRAGGKASGGAPPGAGR